MSPVSSLSSRLLEVLSRPRSEQPAAAADLRAILSGHAEAWNTDFSPGSLFDAFSETTVARGVYAANREEIRPLLRSGFRAVEVGGGNGRLWRDLVPAGARGEVVVVDPHPRGADGVRAEVPGSVVVRHVAAPVQSVELPPADLVIFSLTLHHVAGVDAQQRAGLGLPGPGKREVLAGVRAPVVLVNEADVHCEVDLDPGDPVLLERLCDSYVRRFALSVALDHDAAQDRDHRARLAAVVRDWGLGQLAKAQVPVGERDVYELDVPRWLACFHAAGLRVDRRRFTDPWNLFHQYVLSPR